MIQTRDLTKSFDANRAVENVTVTFPAGTVTALLGLNGAGKTTLLSLLAGLIPPDAGGLTVCGAAAAHLGPGAMNPRHTVEQHLRWLAALAGLDAARVPEVLGIAELAALRRTRIRALSLGLRQRVAIAGTLLCRPRVLLFDEPLNGLDIAGIIWLRTLLRELADAGRAVLVASHQLDEVRRNADRILVLSRGRLVADAQLHDFLGTDPDLEQAYLRAVGGTDAPPEYSR